jgi:hypothetical protein
MTTTFIRFDGNRLKYKTWRRQVFNVARLSSTDDFGIRPFGLTAGQIAALPNPAPGGGPYVFAPALHAGPAPNAAAAITVWKVANDAYQTQRSALNGLIHGIIDSLDEHLLRLITEPDWGTQRQTFLTIITILDDAYGTATATDLTQLKAGLSTPKDGTTTMREFCAHHRQIHEECAGALQPLAEMDRVQALRQCVAHVPQCEAATLHWLLGTPVLANQTFDGLADALCQAAQNLGEPETAATAGYANAAATSLGTERSPYETMMAMMAQQQEQILQLLAAHRSEGKPPNPRGRGTARDAGGTQIPRVRKTDLYCWTHRHCAHTPSDCHLRKPGHQEAATATSRMGRAHPHGRRLRCRG